jgi:peptidylprolyl isomerase
LAVRSATTDPGEAERLTSAKPSKATSVGGSEQRNSISCEEATTVTNPVKDRSGVGLPPKAERRAAAKRAKEQRLRAERRKRILTYLGSVVAVVVVVGGVAAACGAFGNKAAQPQASASAAAATASAPTGALATKPTVTAGTGDLTALKVTTIVDGTGPAVQSGQTLSVNYVGVSYTTGTEFDSSWKNGQPFSFAVGQGNVIKGWDQGLVGVKVGSRVQLDIPSNLAYGDTGNPAGPLRFVVDVLSAA